MKLLITIFVVFVTSSPFMAYSQGIVFEYDNAGNRVKRLAQNAPDLTPFFAISPNAAQGPTNMVSRIRILNVNSSYGLPTTGATITVRILKSSLWAFTWDPTATSNSLGTLNNGIWTYSNSGAYHTWTTTEVIGVGSSRYLGFTSLFNAGASSGTTTITVQIVSQSGGELNDKNNLDVETITYVMP